jgi:hypothetical protein
LMWESEWPQFSFRIRCRRFLWQIPFENTHFSETLIRFILIVSRFTVPRSTVLHLITRHYLGSDPRRHFLPLPLPSHTRGLTSARTGHSYPTATLIDAVYCHASARMSPLYHFGRRFRSQVTGHLILVTASESEFGDILSRHQTKIDLSAPGPFFSSSTYAEFGVKSNDNQAIEKLDRQNPLSPRSGWIKVGWSKLRLHISPGVGFNGLHATPTESTVEMVLGSSSTQL